MTLKVPGDSFTISSKTSPSNSVSDWSNTFKSGCLPSGMLNFRHTEVNKKKKDMISIVTKLERQFPYDEYQNISRVGVMSSQNAVEMKLKSIGHSHPF